MLRHSCGYALANKGQDFRLIQDWLGHRHPKHTSRYTRHVFGHNYKTDRKGAPIEQGLGSDAYWTSPKMRRDVLQSHLNAIAKYGPRGEGDGSTGAEKREAADNEAARIKKLRADAGLIGRFNRRSC